MSFPLVFLHAPYPVSQRVTDLSGSWREVADRSEYFCECLCAIVVNRCNPLSRMEFSRSHSQRLKYRELPYKVTYIQNKSLNIRI